MRLIPLAATALLFAAAPAMAAVIFSDDFQDGDAQGWAAYGKGEVQLSRYESNVSMRLAGGAAAVTALSAAGMADLRVSAAIAAEGLRGDDACVVDVSTDRGATWLEAFRIGDGLDDAVTLHRRGAPVAELADVPQAVLRLRALGSPRRVTCWFDDIAVTGEPVRAMSHGARQHLMAAELTGDDPLPGPVPLAAFAPAAGAAPAMSGFTGRLAFAPDARSAGFRLLVDDFGSAQGTDQSYQVPPPFDFGLVQVDDRLVPVERGSQRSEHSWWEWIVGPGQTWHEAADGDWNRAALPFALQERNANCMHNGVLTFLFRDDGQVSRVVYQISQETCLYLKFDAWGSASARWQQHAVDDSDVLAQRFRREIAARLPVEPISALAADHPGVDPAAFGSALDVAPAHMTAFGVVVEGTHYVGGCDTRAGPYPYCDELLLPSYSLAKTVVAGFSLMRLELLYPDVRNAKVVDYVPACKAAGSWDDVTFDDLLDMATGHYDSTKREEDENLSVTRPFFLVEDHAAKIEIACTRYPRREPPGRTWVYHTSDTYILGTAMNAFWRAKHGQEADFYRDVLALPLWHALRLSPELDVTRRTRDAISQPFAGWGLTLRRDDAARLGKFLAVDGARIDGKRVLQLDEVSAALQQSDADPGLPAAGEDLRYNNGVWAWDAGPYLGCKGQAWIPFMSGFGGISVVMIPNGVVYYYFSDNGDYRWARAVAESQKIGPVCPR